MLYYVPHPGKITSDHIGMEVVINLSDPNMDKKYGTLEKIDNEGNLHIKIGTKKPKKFSPTDDVELVIIQSDKNIRFINSYYFTEEELNNLYDEQVQTQIRERFFKGGTTQQTQQASKEVIDKKFESVKKKRSSKKKTQSKKKEENNSNPEPTPEKEETKPKKPTKKKAVSKKKTTTSSASKKKTQTKRASLLTQPTRNGV